jgi:hypothetical protein
LPPPRAAPARAPTPRRLSGRGLRNWPNEHAAPPGGRRDTRR